MKIAIGMCIGFALSSIIDICIAIKNSKPKNTLPMGDYSWIIEESKALKEDTKSLKERLNDI